MRPSSLLALLALSGQLVVPAFAFANGAREGSTTAPRPRGSSITHIQIGCNTSPRRAPAPVVVIIPTIPTVVISICILPQEILRQRRA